MGEMRWEQIERSHVIGWIKDGSWVWKKLKTTALSWKICELETILLALCTDLYI